MGRFKILDYEEAAYKIKLTNLAFLDSTYLLPKPVSKGLTINISKAVSEDTLRIALKSNSYEKIFVRIHNFRKSFLYLPIALVNGYLKAKIPLNDVPKGVNSITITDSIGIPLAERLFFAHYSNQGKLELTTNKHIYHQREKVTLSLNLNPQYKMAAVSVSAVQSNRVLYKNKTDIESFTYLSQELGALPFNELGNGLANKDYIENVLLIKGWRQYSWQELESIKALDTVNDYTLVEIKGKVLRGDKTPSIQTGINTFGNIVPTVINTLQDGTFELKAKTLLTPHGKDMYVAINDQSKLNYTINIEDPIALLIPSIIKNLVKLDSYIPSFISNSEVSEISRKEKSIGLREVVIGGKNDLSFDYNEWNGKKRKKNECGDYVCIARILNCPNHVDDRENVEPTPGDSYQIEPGVLKTRVYSGCIFFKKKDLKYFVPVTAIHLEKEFYENNYQDALEPASFSTIYWQYSALLEKNKPATISFYTSDITGDFKIIVQGLVDEDVVYGEHFFKVISKAFGKER